MPSSPNSERQAEAQLVDTHCHLASGELLQRADEVITGAAAVGVTRLVCVACVPAEWDEALHLRWRYQRRVWLAVGIHPHEAARAGQPEWTRLAEIWQVPGLIGCGEMGLDYHYDFSPRQIQRSVFARQLALARQTDLPVIIHCREAHDDVVTILLDHGYSGRRVVFHCFGGTYEQALELWSHDWWTSFTGTITFPKSHEQQRVCREAAAEHLMFETDAPYLAPEPVRRVRPNQPHNLPHTVRFAAALRDVSYENLADRSTANAIRFFGLDCRTDWPE